jgi:predicted peptidase
MPYRLFVPASLDPQRQYPLLLWLHGSRGRGSDNRRQLAGANAWALNAFVNDEAQARYPSFVVAPQCPRRRTWDRWASDDLSRELRLVIEILEALQQEFSIDPARIYVAGESMGGFGTWSLILKRPQLFAAAITLCGGGKPDLVHRVTHLPIWVFHGAADRSVSVRRSRQMVEALRNAGGDPKYSEYPKVGHNVWKRAFAEPDLLPWLFSQVRPGAELQSATPH